jgi:4-azaleucine resistance transporter AzlC
MTQLPSRVTRRSELLDGIKMTAPLVIGAIPFALIFGALAVTSGLSPWAAIGMSLFVFAGSAQFIAVGLVGAGSALPVIWLTTFIVNVRHVLYAASLAPYVRHLGHRWMLPLGAWLTDETYIVVVKRFEQADASPHKHWFYLGSASIMYVSWNVFTLIGVVFGSAVPDPSRWGLDFAMSATFIGMMVPAIKNRPALAAVVVAGAVAVAAHSLPNQLWLILATLCGIGAAVLAERTSPASTSGEPAPQP